MPKRQFDSKFGKAAYDRSILPSLRRSAKLSGRLLSPFARSYHQPSLDPGCSGTYIDTP
jgi:hypothetical protein